MHMFMYTYFPFLITDDVIPIVDMEISAPPLLEGITDQLEVTRSTVVLSMGEHRAVQVAQILRTIK
jgi:hypothetical protein